MKKQEVNYNKEVFIGSDFWFFFWILIFWPIAIFYYFSERKVVNIHYFIKEKSKLQKNLWKVILGSILILIGGILIINLFKMSWEIAGAIIVIIALIGIILWAREGQPKKMIKQIL
ncbi:MAG: hypothetical protein ACTSWK_16860 [Promethearchaeota archaeon]